jgi:hypothetical protein
MLYLAGIVITIFLAVLLAGKKHKSPADRILIVWLCAIAFHLLLYYLFISGDIYKYPAILGIHLPYPLIHGPFLFLYTAELTGLPPKKKTAWLLHFLPIVILYMLIIPFFNLSSAEKIHVYRNNGAGYETIIQVCFFAIIISGIAYVTASLFLLRRYRKSIEDEFSNIEKINLAWLRYLIYGIAVIWICVIIGNDPVIFLGRLSCLYFFWDTLASGRLAFLLRHTLNPVNSKLHPQKKYHMNQTPQFSRNNPRMMGQANLK